MSWWKTAIYDTCSLITIDKICSEGVQFENLFPSSLLALEASFSDDGMYQTTAERMRSRVKFVELPPLHDFERILNGASLPLSLSEVDRSLFATCLHTNLPVVTGDRQLAKAITQNGLAVGDVPTILKDLVRARKLSQSGVMALIQKLAKKREFILRVPNPNIEDLRRHSFPD